MSKGLAENVSLLSEARKTFLSAKKNFSRYPLSTVELTNFYQRFFFFGIKTNFLNLSAWW